MKHGEQVSVYHTISEGATATVTEGFLFAQDEHGITIRQRVPTSATHWRHVFIPTLRLAKVVGPEYLPGEH